MHYLQAYSQIIGELKRLGWTERQGQQHLKDTYNLCSRALLSCRQIQEFEKYLRQQQSQEQQSQVSSVSSFDYSQVNNRITVELNRTRWTKVDEENYLQRFYGQKERSLLEKNQLRE